MWLIWFVVAFIIWLGFYIEESIMHYLTGVSILDQIKNEIISLLKIWLRIQSPSGCMSNDHKEARRDD